MDTEIWIIHDDTNYDDEQTAYRTWEEANAHLWFLWGQTYAVDKDLQKLCRDEYHGNARKMIAELIEINDQDDIWYSKAILKE